MNQLYYIELDGQQYGLYELEQVKEYGLFADTLVLANGSEEWKPASEYPELAGCILESDVAPVAIDVFNANYYYKGENQRLYGPFSLLELAYLGIDENTLLGIDGTENWYYASEIKDLLDMLSCLADLDKEGFDTELQRIRDKDESDLKEQDLRSILSKQELKKIIEEQEKEIVELEKENRILKSQNNEQSDENLAKGILIN
jgi:hypothetical protein